MLGRRTRPRHREDRKRLVTRRVDGITAAYSDTTRRTGPSDGSPRIRAPAVSSRPAGVDVADPRLVPADKCGHCGCETSRPSFPAARTSAADDHWRSERRDLDEIGDDESWLWRLVDEADRVFAAAPPAPDAQRLAAAERTHAQATAFEDRIQMQIRAAVAALAARLSWL